MDEEVSLVDDEKLRWGACGPNEVEYAAARTPLATMRLPSEQTKTTSLVSGVVSADAGAMSMREQSCLEASILIKSSESLIDKNSSPVFAVMLCFNFDSIERTKFVDLFTKSYCNKFNFSENSFDNSFTKLMTSRLTVIGSILIDGSLRRRCGKV